MLTPSYQDSLEYCIPHHHTTSSRFPPPINFPPPIKWANTASPWDGLYFRRSAPLRLYTRVASVRECTSGDTASLYTESDPAELDIGDPGRREPSNGRKIDVLMRTRRKSAISASLNTPLFLFIFDDVSGIWTGGWKLCGSADFTAIERL